MDPLQRLRQVGLFSDLSDDDLARICRDAAEVRLEPGELLFEEDDPGEHAYVITSGSVEIVKATEGREALVAVREPGSVIGEMALLHEAPRMATVRARDATELLAISKVALDELLAVSPTAARAMFRALIERMQETSERLRHSERMAQLGTLTAGVAHELNNPAAAVRRAAETLDTRLDDWAALLVGHVSPDQSAARERALALLAAEPTADPTADPTTVAGALDRSDAEAELEAWLERHGAREPWRLAPELADAGVDAALLERLGGLEGDTLTDAAWFVAVTTSVRRLVGEVSEGARRLSDIVRALKGYAYLDRGPVQEVDVVRGLEDTLVLLGHRTRQVRVVREFEPGLPRIAAQGSELNQVWTNLIDNACDALEDVDDDRVPTLTLRARVEGDDVVVEVEDNGPGIAPEVRERIFDAFFTTKPPGRGTGLGLQISYRVVALEHRGALTVDSEPGRTTFRVVLPTSPPQADR